MWGEGVTQINPRNGGLSKVSACHLVLVDEALEMGINASTVDDSLESGHQRNLTAVR